MNKIVFKGEIVHVQLTGWASEEPGPVEGVRAAWASSR